LQVVVLAVMAEVQAVVAVVLVEFYQDQQTLPLELHTLLLSAMVVVVVYTLILIRTVATLL
jgi:hypothetical protein